LRKLRSVRPAQVCQIHMEVADSPACKCGRGGGAVLHVLLRCSLYVEARKALRAAAGDR
jgi:hypothetical protein